MLGEFVSKTAGEAANLYYDFTICGEVLFCREAYVGAEGLQKHLENVGTQLQALLKLAEVVRLEVHGTPMELAKLKEPLGALKPEWFEFECGVERGN